MWSFEDWVANGNLLRQYGTSKEITLLEAQVQLASPTELPISAACTVPDKLCWISLFPWILICYISNSPLDSNIFTSNTPLYSARIYTALAWLILQCTKSHGGTGLWKSVCMFKDRRNTIKLGAVSGLRGAASPWQCLDWRRRVLEEQAADPSTDRVWLRGFLKARQNHRITCWKGPPKIIKF